MGGWRWESQRRDVSITKKEKKERERETNEIRKHQRLNKYREPRATLHSEARCYKLGEESNLNSSAILNPREGNCEPAGNQQRQRPGTTKRL